MKILIFGYLFIGFVFSGCGPAFLVPAQGEESVNSGSHSFEDILEDQEPNSESDFESQLAGGVGAEGVFDFRITCQGVRASDRRYSEGPWSGPSQAHEPSGKTYRAVQVGNEASFRDVIELSQTGQCYLVWSRSFPDFEISQASYRHSVLNCSNLRSEISGPQGAELHRSGRYWMIPLTEFFSEKREDPGGVGATQLIDLRLTSADQKFFNIRVHFRVKRN